MRLTQRRKEGLFYFAVEQHTADVPGAEVKISVFSSYEGEGVPLLQRALYFDEQSQEHIGNFCKVFAHDKHYRSICLGQTAHWCRVARLYELNAGIIVDEGEVPAQSLEKTCKELFHFLRRDLAIIEQHPIYLLETARLGRNEETALREVLSLLSRVPQVEIASACQGSFSIQVKDRTIFLPSCHTRHATINFTSLPASFLYYLQSGPLGQQHLAQLEPERISSQRVVHNRSIIRMLAAATLAYLHKHGSVHSPSPAHGGG